MYIFNIYFFIIIIISKILRGPEGGPERGQEGGVQLLSTPVSHTEFSKSIWPSMCPLITQRGHRNKVRASVMPLVCGLWYTVCSYHNLTSHVHNYSTNV